MPYWTVEQKRNRVAIVEAADANVALEIAVGLMRSMLRADDVPVSTEGFTTRPSTDQEAADFTNEKECWSGEVSLAALLLL